MPCYAIGTVRARATREGLIRALEPGTIGAGLAAYLRVRLGELVPGVAEVSEVSGTWGARISASWGGQAWGWLSLEAGPGGDLELRGEGTWMAKTGAREALAAELAAVLDRMGVAGLQRRLERILRDTGRLQSAVRTPEGALVLEFEA